MPKDEHNNETVNDLAALRALVEQQAAQIANIQAHAPAVQALELLAQRSAPRENPDYNEISCFTYPEGERVRPKPKLSRETFFCGPRCRNEELTPAEIDAFNAITSSRTAREGTWTAEVRQNGTAQELHVMVPSRTVDDRMNLPGSLLLILGELQYGKAAVDPAALAERVAALEAERDRALSQAQA